MAGRRRKLGQSVRATYNSRLDPSCEPGDLYSSFGRTDGFTDTKLLENSASLYPLLSNQIICFPKKNSPIPELSHHVQGSVYIGATVCILKSLKSRCSFSEQHWGWGFGGVTASWRLRPYQWVNPLIKIYRFVAIGKFWRWVTEMFLCRGYWGTCPLPPPWPPQYEYLRFIVGDVSHSVGWALA